MPQDGYQQECWIFGSAEDVLPVDAFAYQTDTGLQVNCSRHAPFRVGMVRDYCGGVAMADHVEVEDIEVEGHFVAI